MCTTFGVHFFGPPCISIYIQEILWIVSRHRGFGFGETGNLRHSIRRPRNRHVEPNMKWIGRPLAEIWPFEIFPNVYEVVGRRSVGPQYILLLTLISYTPLRYVRNVAREE